MSKDDQQKRGGFVPVGDRSRTCLVSVDREGPQGPRLKVDA